MASNIELLDEGDFVAKDLLIACGKWRSAFVRPVITHARIVIEGLVSRLRDQIKETHRLADVARENETISNRIVLAIGELESSKRNRKSEKAFAIIISPYQFECLRWGSFPARPLRRESVPARFMDLPVYTAKGVYGPLVLTEEAFNGLTRQAPELMLKAA